MRKYCFFGILFLLFAIVPHAKAQSVIGLSFHDSTVTYRPTIDVPVYVDSTTTGKGILSFQLQVTFSSYYLTPMTVLSAGTMTEAAGMTYTFYATTSKMTIVAAGTSATVGSGKLIYIRFQVNNPGGSYVSLSDTLSSYFNQKSPRSKINKQSGYISVGNPPSISVLPNTGLLTAGETLQFTAYSGVQPYSWSVTNPVAASISTTGTLTGLHKGFTNVTAIDANGTKFTTGLVEIRAFKLTVPDTSQYVLKTIDIPIRTTNLTGLNIASGKFTVTYSSYYLSFVNIITTGTILSAATVMVNSKVSGQLTIVFAGNTVLASTGTLIWLRFNILSSSGQSGITPGNAVFNEDISGNTLAGNLTALGLNSLNLNPNTSTLAVPDKLQFSVSGGTAPYIWTVSDPSVAVISTSGLLTTIHSGNINITVQDALGSIKTTGTIAVYDTRISVVNANGIPGGYVDVPITMANLPAGESFSSMKLVLTYNSSVLLAVGVTTSGTMPNGWTFSLKNVSNQITIAAAGINPVTSGGVLAKIRFLVLTTATIGATSYVNFQQVIFDQFLPVPLTANGTVYVGPTAVNVLTYLQGAYLSNTGLMTTALQSYGFLPPIDPYSNLVSSTLPTTMVDWIRLEIRTSIDPASVVMSTSAILKSDGTIVPALSGVGQVMLDPAIVQMGNYYIVIRHRNHLPIMSAMPVALLANSSSLYNFTSGQSQAYSSSQNPLMQLGTYLYGMISGDATADGVINAADRVVIKNHSGATGYLMYDINLDGVCNAVDRTLVLVSNFKVTQVP